MSFFIGWNERVTPSFPGSDPVLRPRFALGSDLEVWFWIWGPVERFTLRGCPPSLLCRDHRRSNGGNGIGFVRQVRQTPILPAFSAAFFLPQTKSWVQPDAVR